MVGCPGVGKGQQDRAGVLGERPDVSRVRDSRWRGPVAECKFGPETVNVPQGRAASFESFLGGLQRG